jgi:hypothetical protein
MSESQRHAMVRAKVQKLKDFYVHLAVYIVVNSGLLAINLFNEPDKLWFHWVLIGWGVGVLGHAAHVFGGGVGKNWEERKIKEILKRESSEKTTLP